ncbi:unnamed protein product, partial [Prorocentrum cordatum]
QIEIPMPRATNCAFIRRPEKVKDKVILWKRNIYWSPKLAPEHQANWVTAVAERIWAMFSRARAARRAGGKWAPVLLRLAGGGNDDAGDEGGGVQLADQEASEDSGAEAGSQLEASPAREDPASGVAEGDGDAAPASSTPMTVDNANAGAKEEAEGATADAECDGVAESRPPCAETARKGKRSKELREILKCSPSQNKKSNGALHSATSKDGATTHEAVKSELMDKKRWNEFKGGERKDTDVNTRPIYLAFETTVDDDGEKTRAQHAQILSKLPAEEIGAEKDKARGARALDHLTKGAAKGTGDIADGGKDATAPQKLRAPRAAQPEIEPKANGAPDGADSSASSSQRAPSKGSDSNGGTGIDLTLDMR